jgi:hypothetical protein
LLFREALPETMRRQESCNRNGHADERNPYLFPNQEAGRETNCHP